jgi:hypothetical protein
MQHEFDKEIQLTDDLERIFMPLAYKKRAKIRQDGGKFVHYTSAENAVNIIRNKQIWMRNVRCMNDYSEAYHGHLQLTDILNKNPIKQTFIEVLSIFGEELGKKIIVQYYKWWENLQFNTYITSISEHEDFEDRHGRLSMWRAYGGNSAKAAIVMRLPLNPGAVRGLRVMLSPVEYISTDKLLVEFEAAIQSVSDNSEFLRTVPVEQIQSFGFFMLAMAALCQKHEGFKEEKEWRIIYLPDVVPSEHITKRVEAVGGVPQIVYKISLNDNPDEGITGIKIPNIVDRIIVGPSVYPEPIKEAFIELLKDAGVEQANSKVVVSNIPLRT